MSTEINSGFAEYDSTGNAVADTLTTTAQDFAYKGITTKPHVQIGVTFTDNNGDAATPGAGTYTVTVETLNNPGVFQPIQGGTSVSATAALTTHSVNGHITRVKVAPDSITTATLYNVKVTASAA